MKEAGHSRSLASSEASRRNGALSQGPRTALGKARSARNSRKHGLFSSDLLVAEALRVSAIDLAGDGGQTSAGWLDLADQRQVISLARVQLEHATQLVSEMRVALDQMLAQPVIEVDAVAELLRHTARISGYQRRFRGRRDRALRRMMAPSAQAAEVCASLG